MLSSRRYGEIPIEYFALQISWCGLVRADLTRLF
jgi:hypothetical protein